MIKAFRNDGNAFIVIEGASMRTMRLHRDVMAGADNRDSDIRRNPMSGWIPIFRESDNRLDSDNPRIRQPVGFRYPRGLQPRATNTGTPGGVLLCFVDYNVCSTI